MKVTFNADTVFYERPKKDKMRYEVQMMPVITIKTDGETIVRYENIKRHKH